MREVPRVDPLLSRGAIVALFILGLANSEFSRWRWGLRPGGIIVIPLVGLFAFRDVWLLALYLGVVALAYVGIRFISWWTLLYGRVLLSMAIVVGLFTVLVLVDLTPIQNGVLPFFTGILGGVSAYSANRTPPADRPAMTVLTASMFSGFLGVIWLLLSPAHRGTFQSLDPPLLVLLGIVVLAGLGVVYRQEVRYPSNDVESLAHPSDFEP